jgi:hypothetical protein
MRLLGGEELHPTADQDRGERPVPRPQPRSRRRGCARQASRPCFSMHRLIESRATLSSGEHSWNTSGQPMCLACAMEPRERTVTDAGTGRSLWKRGVFRPNRRERLRVHENSRRSGPKWLFRRDNSGCGGAGFDLRPSGYESESHLWNAFPVLVTGASWSDELHSDWL